MLAALALWWYVDYRRKQALWDMLRRAGAATGTAPNWYGVMNALEHEVTGIAEGKGL